MAPRPTSSRTLLRLLEPKALICYSILRRLALFVYTVFTHFSDGVRKNKSVTKDPSTGGQHLSYREPPKLKRVRDYIYKKHLQTTPPPSTPPPKKQQQKTSPLAKKQKTKNSGRCFRRGPCLDVMQAVGAAAQPPPRPRLQQICLAREEVMARQEVKVLTSMQNEPKMAVCVCVCFLPQKSVHLPFFCVLFIIFFSQGVCNAMGGFFLFFFSQWVAMQWVFCFPFSNALVHLAMGLKWVGGFAMGGCFLQVCFFESTPTMKFCTGSF